MFSHAPREGSSQRDLHVEPTYDHQEGGLERSMIGLSLLKTLVDWMTPGTLFKILTINSREGCNFNKF